MTFTEKIFNRFGYKKEPKKKAVIKPWSDFPDDERTLNPLLSESPPVWNSEDYLKECKGWVYACVAAIADEISTIKLHLYKRKEKGVEEVFDSSLLDLLYRVNDYTTKADHWYLTQNYLELVGEAPWLLDRSGENKEPVAIYLLRPDKLTIKFDKEKIIGKYIYDVGGGKKEEFEPEDLILIKYPNPLRPFRGLGTLEAAAQTVNLDRYAEKWNVNFFYNSARPDGILTTNNKLTSDQRKTLSKMWNKQFRGIGKNAKLAILESGLTYKQMQLSQKDMDFLEQQKFSMSKILSIFRVPKSVIAITEDVNLANAETAAYAFARWTIKPKMTKIVEQLNEFLVPMFGDDLFLDFEDPVPENVEMKIKKYKEALGPSGWMSVNEVRDIEGLKPIEGGDSIYRPVANMPVGEVQKQMIVSRKAINEIKKEKEKNKYREQRLSINARNTRKRGVEKLEDGIKKIIQTHLNKNKHAIKKAKNIKGNK